MYNAANNYSTVSDTELNQETGEVYEVLKKIGNVYSVILNIKNPVETSSRSELNKISVINNDGAIVNVKNKEDASYGVEAYDEYVVFEPSQIFILNSDKAHKQIEEFVKGKITLSKTEQIKQDVDDVLAKGPADLTKDELIKKIIENDNLFEKNQTLKAYNKEETKEVIDAALDWYNSPAAAALKAAFPFNVVFAAVNSKQAGPVGNWAVGAITLYQYYRDPNNKTIDKKISADYTDLYHEAWHGFTQTFLTQKQRDLMYKEASKMKGSFVAYNGNYVSFSNATKKQLDEYVAEGFRTFMISGGTIKQKETPIKNNIFQKILNFFKALFGNATVKDVLSSKETASFPAIQELYNKLRIGDLTGFTYNEGNVDRNMSPFESTIRPSLKNILDKRLSVKDSEEVFETVNSLFVKAIDEANELKKTTAFTGAFFKDEERVKLGYQYVFNEFKNVIIPRLEKELSEAKTDELKISIQNSLNLANYVIRNDNFGDINNLKNNRDGRGIIAYHQMKSQYISNEDKEAFFNISDEETLEKGTVLFKNDDNTVSQQNLANPDINFLLNSLYLFDKNNKPVYNQFGVQKLADYSKMFSMVAKTLTGNLAIEKMWNLLNEKAETNMSIKHLMTKLGPLKSDTIRVDVPKVFTLQTLFWQSFNLTNIQLMQMNVEQEKETVNGITKYNYNITIGKSSTPSKKIGEEWENTFKSISANSNDPNDDNYIKLDPAENKNRLIINKVLEKFYPNGKFDNLNSLAFFTAIGLQFTENPAIALKINGSDEYGAIYVLKNLKVLLDNGIKINSLNDIFKEYKDLNLATLEARYNKLQELEFKYSETSYNAMVTNAEGNSQYENSLNNTLTINADAINNASTYYELIAQPYMAHLDINKNPLIGASIWMNRLFEMNSINKRKRGNIKIIIGNLSGVQIITDEKTEDGIATNAADEFTKFIQDYHLILNGTPELMRAADKTSSFTAHIQGHKLYINTDSFLDDKGFAEAHGILTKYIAAELIKINKFKDLQKKVDAGDKIIFDFNYLKEGQKFVIFEDVLTKETQNKLLNENFNDKSVTEIENLIYDNNDINLDIVKDLKNYFEGNVNGKEGQVERNRKLLNDVQGKDVLLGNNFINNIKKGNPEIDNSLVLEAALKSFTYNSFIHNLETISIFYGDIAQYKIAAEEFHKRNAGAGSTGKLFRNDKVAIDFINSRGRGWAKRKGKKEKTLTYSGEIDTAVLEDNIIPTAYLKDITDAITEDITKRYAKATLPDNIKAERIKEEVGDYFDKMKEGDAQGWITFDMYRILAYLEGNWSDEQEKLYKQIINEEEVSITDTLTFFPVRKFQYWGTLKNEYASLNAFHKFSLMPLIPNVIKDKKLMLLHDKMMNEEIDYALFESGSKIATVTTNGIKDKFYTDKVNRDFSESNFTKNTVYLQFLKDQLEIAPKYKDKATFSTQLRKLVEIGLMEAGVPIDFSPGLDLDERITKWNKLDSDAKLKESDNYKLIKDYESNIKKLVDLNKAKFIKDAGIEFNANGEIIVTEKFKEYLLKELSKQELAEHELAFININSETNILNDLSISLSSDKLEQILNSILINRLIKQKFKGESLVQVSGVGFESIIPKFTKATEEEKLRYAGTNDLPSYRRGMSKNGNTTACKVKIALQGDFMNLLDIIHPDGKKIETLDRLNALIQDDAWLDANNGDNRKMITMVGVRIPVQGLNSMEFMEVYEFLHPDAGTMIVLPSEIVAKTGGDFDIDKLTVLMPNIKGNFNYDKWSTKEGRTELIKLQQENPSLKDKLTPDNVNIIFDIIKNNQEDYVLDQTDKAVFNLLKINSLYDVKYVKGDKTTAGLENAIVNNIKQMLELPSNYLSLVKPNGTYILKPIAQELEDDVTKYDPKYRISGEKTDKIAGTRLLEVGYNLYKHRSNNIGKQVLSIFAVSNTYNSVFNRIGMRMNNEYIFGKGEKTKFKKRLDIMFNHNIQKVNGKDVISLSHLLDANNEYYIADIISQLINGSVDVAKDAWLFLIQANKEVASSLEFLIEAGVPIKQAIYFVSQPVIRDYIYEQQKAKSIIIDVKAGKEKDNPAFHQSTARKIMLKRIFNQEMSDTLDDPKYTNDKRQKYIYDETVKLTSTDEFIDFVTISAETNLLTKIKSKDQTISDIDKGLLLHFFEIEDMAKTVTSVKLATSFDTSTPIGLYEAEEKIRVSKELATNSMIPKDVLKNIIEQSPIGPFAIQDFFVKVFKGFFKFRNNDTVNNFVKDLISQKKDLILETFNNDIPDFNRTYKNNLLSFIYQNELKTFDIDAITNYKGVPVRSGVNIVTIESVMKLNSGVGVKKVDEKNIIYIDRAQLKADYTNRVSIGGDPISVDNKVISKPAKVDASAFPFANDYYRFVIEREILRANSSLDSFSERLDYQDNLKENKKINKKELNESSETFDNRMKVLTYEQLLRDLALDNTFNTWKMFKSNTSVAKQFIKILNQYPELKNENNYDIIKNLIGDEEKKSIGLPINNLILRDRLYSVEKLNIFYQDLLELANPSEIKIKASDVEKARVSLFFDNLSNYAFFQSGMNTTSKFSIIRVIPQERILRLMLSFSQSFSEGVNINLLEKFNSVFWKNQKLFSKNRLNDLQINDYNFKPINSDFLESEQLLLKEDNKGNIIYKEANEIDTVKATIEANPNVTFLFESTVNEPPGISNSFNEASKEFGNTLPLGIKPTSTTSYSDVSEIVDSGQPVVTEVQPTQLSTSVKVIALTSNFTRDSVKKDSDYIYLFTDNAKRTSGSNKIKPNWYTDKYGIEGNYPTMTQAIIRGLENAFPITTMMDDNRTQWTDDKFEEFKQIIDSEISEIKDSIKDGDFKGVKFAAQMPFGKGNISNMKDSAPKIWNYLNTKLAEIGIDNTGAVPVSTQLSTNKIGFDISKIAPNKKDPKKAAIATDMIGYGRDTATRKSSTKKYQDAAIAQSIPVNSGNYNQNTVAFISVSGNNVATTEDIEQTVYRAQEVLNAGGSIIMDNKDNRESSWNKSGELAVFNLLTSIVHKYNLENISKDLDYVQLKLKSIPTQSSTSVESNLPGPDTKINIYAGARENAELSNFAVRPFIVETDEITEGNFKTVEGAYQASKVTYAFDNATEEEDVFNQSIVDKLETASGAEAKKLGRQIIGLDQEAWDDRSSQIMKKLLLESFKQNPDALAKLLATGNATLTHTQDKGKWGTEFPRLLMEVRNELRTTQSSTSVKTTQKEQIKQVDKTWYNKFWEYVKSGYYQQFIKDLQKTKSKEEIDEINKQIRQVYIQDLQQKYPQLGNVKLQSDNSTLKVENEQILKDLEPTFTKLMVGNHGIYMEFNEPKDKGIFVKKRMQYNEYERNGKKLYDQFQTVNYADYKAGKWYGDINDYNLTNQSTTTQSSTSNVITGYPQVNPIVKANIDKMIDAALQLKAKGGLIGFPSKGFGQDMLKGGVNNTPIARQTFIYLSKRLLELEFINPGFEKTLQSVDPQQDKTAIELIQEKQPITNKDVLDGLMHCFS